MRLGDLIMFIPIFPQGLFLAERSIEVIEECYKSTMFFLSFVFSILFNLEETSIREDQCSRCF